jgi:hypothetical protein
VRPWRLFLPRWTPPSSFGDLRPSRVRAGPVGFRLLAATVPVAGLTSMFGVGAGLSALPPQPCVARLAPES